MAPPEREARNRLLTEILAGIDVDPWCERTDMVRLLEAFGVTCKPLGRPEWREELWWHPLHKDLDVSLGPREAVHTAVALRVLRIVATLTEREDQVGTPNDDRS